MFATKSLIAAAAAIAFAGQATAFSMPTCWSTCFYQYNVTAESSLCIEPVKDAVSSCILSGCAASNATAAGYEYSAWLCKYCNSTSPACSTSVNASTIPVPSTLYTAPLTTATGTGVPSVYANSTGTATYSGPASTGSVWSTASATVTPYTGAAAGLKTAGSVVVLVGGAAMGLLL